MALSLPSPPLRRPTGIVRHPHAERCPSDSSDPDEGKRPPYTRGSPWIVARRDQRALTVHLEARGARHDRRRGQRRRIVARGVEPRRTAGGPSSGRGRQPLPRRPRSSRTARQAIGQRLDRLELHLVVVVGARGGRGCDRLVRQRSGGCRWPGPDSRPARVLGRWRASGRRQAAATGKRRRRCSPSSHVRPGPLQSSVLRAVPDRSRPCTPSTGKPAPVYAVISVAGPSSCTGAFSKSSAKISCAGAGTPGTASADGAPAAGRQGR